MTRILNILRTPGAMLAALLLALLAQLEHTAQVFSMVVDATGIQAQLHAYAFAVAVETAVLLFVLAGHKWISYGFALATAATNLSYYAMNGINLFSVAALPAWLMSLLLPAAIVGYSHTIAEQDEKTQDEPQAPAVAQSTTTTEGTENAQEPTGGWGIIQTGGSATTADSGQALGSGPQSTGATTPQATTQPPARKVRKARRKATPPAPAQRRAQIVSSGLDDAGAIAAAFNVSVRTAQLDLEQIRKMTTQTNGVHP